MLALQAVQDLPHRSTFLEVVHSFPHVAFPYFIPDQLHVHSKFQRLLLRVARLACQLTSRQAGASSYSGLFDLYLLGPRHRLSMFQQCHRIGILVVWVVVARRVGVGPRLPHHPSIVSEGCQKFFCC